MGLSKVSGSPVPVLAPVLALGLTLLAGCMQHHEAKVQTALLPPPSASPVQHTGRLWVELGDATWETQCRFPKGQRQVCFAGVRRAAFGALARSLWTTFPEVTLRDGEPVPAGDYLLKLDVTLDAMPPDADGPGWSAIAAGGFRLSRDGKILHEERLGSRSRASFAYGSALGVGAGEVVDAFAAHVAQVLGAVPEQRPLRPAPLPAVVAEILTPGADSTPAMDGSRTDTPAEAAPEPPMAGAETAPVAPAPTPASEPAPPALPAAPGPAAEPPPTPAASPVSPPTTPVAAR